MTRVYNINGAFDFNEEVANAKAQYPEETKNVVFINASNKKATQKLADALLEMSGVYRRWLLQTKDDEYIDMSAEVLLREIGTMSLIDPFSGRRIFTFDPKNLLIGTGVEPDTMKRFAFRHELAHIVIEGANIEQLIPALAKLEIANPEHQDEIRKALGENECLRENIADSFGAISGLAEKWLTASDIGKIALKRAQDAVLNFDVTHLTTVSLDKLVLKAHDAAFVSLSAQEISALAKAHGTAFAPTTTAAQETRLLFSRADRLTTAMTRALTGKNAATDEYVTHVAARILEAELKNDSSLPPPEKNRIAAILAAHKRLQP